MQSPAARHIAQRKIGQAIARAMSPERMERRWTIAIGSAWGCPACDANGTTSCGWCSTNG